jgi:protein-S-isoprenylcysteine O-methyltransferase Ste14
VLEWRVRLRTLLSRQGSVADADSRAVVYASVVAGCVGRLRAGRRGAGGGDPSSARAAVVAGLVVVVAGTAIRQWAVTLLGQFFTTSVRVHTGQTVVDTGPYRWVRHPSYTGLILTFVGLGLALGNWAALAILLVVPTGGLVFRIRVEERALLAALGEPYRRFMASRARLIPGVW